MGLKIVGAWGGGVLVRLLPLHASGRRDPGTVRVTCPAKEHAQLTWILQVLEHRLRMRDVEFSASIINNKIPGRLP